MAKRTDFPDSPTTIPVIYVQRVNPGGIRMLSDVLRDRMITVLRFWDADRDGAIEESDYAVAAGRMAGRSGFAPGSAEYEQLHGQLVRGGWELLRQLTATAMVGFRLRRRLKVSMGYTPIGSAFTTSSSRRRSARST
jgi:hypothetical protein